MHSFLFCVLFFSLPFLTFSFFLALVCQETTKTVGKEERKMKKGGGKVGSNNKTSKAELKASSRVNSVDEGGKKEKVRGRKTSSPKDNNDNGDKGGSLEKKTKSKTTREDNAKDKEKKGTKKDKEMGEKDREKEQREALDDNHNNNDKKKKKKKKLSSGVTIVEEEFFSMSAKVSIYTRSWIPPQSKYVIVHKLT